MDPQLSPARRTFVGLPAFGSADAVVTVPVLTAPGEVHTWAEFEGFGVLLALAEGCRVESSLTTGVRSGITGFTLALGVADALRLAELL